MQNPFGNSFSANNNNNANIFGNNQNINNSMNNQNNTNLNPFGNSTMQQNNAQNTLIFRNQRLTDIYNAYLPNSLTYKFSNVFYNLSQTKIQKPNNFTDEEWKKYYINDHLMPVKLTFEEICARHKKQNDLIMKLNTSKFDMNEKLDALNNLKMVVHNKMKKIIGLLRKHIKNNLTNASINSYSLNNPNVISLQNSASREKLYVQDKNSVLFAFLKIKKQLEEMEEKIKRDLKDLEQGGISKVKF